MAPKGKASAAAAAGAAAAKEDDSKAAANANAPAKKKKPKLEDVEDVDDAPDEDAPKGADADAADADADEGEGEGDGDEGEGDEDEGEGEGDEGEDDGEGEGDEGEGEGEGEGDEGEGEGEDDKSDAKADAKKPAPAPAPKASAAPAAAAASASAKDVKAGAADSKHSKSSSDVKGMPAAASATGASAGAMAAAAAAHSKLATELKRSVSDATESSGRGGADDDGVEKERSGRRGWGYAVKPPASIEALGVRAPVETAQHVAALAELVGTVARTALRKQLMYAYLVPAFTQLSAAAINPPQKPARVRSAPAALAAVAADAKDQKSGGVSAAAAAGAAARDVKDVKGDVKGDSKSAPAAAAAAARPPPGLAPISVPVASAAPAGSSSGSGSSSAAQPAGASTPLTPAVDSATAAATAAALRESKAAVGSAVTAVLNTMHSWTDRRSQLYVERAIYLCVRDNALFATTFANALALYLSKHVVRTESQYSYLPVVLKLYRWLNVLLRATAASKAGLSALAKGLPVLLKLQLQLLQKFRDDAAGRATAGAALTALLNGKNKAVADTLLPVYVKTIESAPNALTFSVALERVVLFLAKPKQAERLKQHKAALVKWLDEEVVGAKDGVSSSDDVALFVPFARTLTHDDFANPILATIKRMFLRMPDRLLTVLRTLFPGLTIDLSRYLPAILDGVVSELRNADAARREAAVDFVGVLAGKMSDPAALKQLVTVLGNNLLAKGTEVLAVVDNRLTVIAALNRVAIACATNASGVAAAARDALTADAIAVLRTFLDKEAVPACRGAAVRAIGTCLRAQSDATDFSGTIEFVVNGADGKAKDEKCAADYLYTLLDLITPPEAKGADLTPAGAAIVDYVTKYPEQLQELMRLGTEKALHRTCGLLSVAVLLRAIVARDVNEQGTIWGMTTDADSMLNSAELIEAAGPEELMAHATVIAAVLETSAIFTAIKNDVNNETGYGAFFKATMLLLTHSDAKLRRAVSATVTRAIALDTDVTTHLIPAFVSVLHGLSDEEFDAEKKHEDERYRRAQRLEHALVLVCSPAPNALFADVSLAAHHPYVLTGADDEERLRQDRVWKRVVRVWKRTLPAGWVLPKAIAAAAPDYAKLLLSETGFNSTDRDQRYASKALLSTLTAIHPVAVFESVFPGVVTILDAPMLAALSKYEQAVYTTPEGQLCTWKDPDQYKAEKTTSANVKVAASAKSKSSGYKAADLEWERKHKAEQERKKKEADDAKDRETKLAEESELRTKIWRMAAPVVAVLDGLCVLAKRVPRTTHDLLLAPTLRKLSPLLRDPVVGKEAAAAHLQLARTLDVDLAEEFTILARAACAVHVDDVKLWDSMQQTNVVARALGVVADVCDGSGRLSSPSFTFVWPIVQCVIRNSADDKKIRSGLANAMNVLATHCQDDMNRGESRVGFVRLPMQPCVELLLHVLAKLADFKADAHEALLRLCGALRVDEISFLLSDIGVLSPADDVRLASLQGLGCVPSLEPVSIDLLAKLWVVSHDSRAEVVAAAQELWTRSRLELSKDTYDEPLIALLSHTVANVRYAAGLSLAAAMEKFPATAGTALDKLLKLFVASPDQVIENKMNIRAAKTYISRWETRSGVALALHSAVASVRGRKSLEECFKFLMDHALADTNDQVWQSSLQAGLRLIEVHGRDHLQWLLPLFEQYIEKLGSDDIEIEKEVADRVREGVVVLLGTLARYLQDNKKVQNVVTSLLEVLKTPSHSVQKAVAECLSPLMHNVTDQSKIADIINTLLVRLAKAESYGVRKGAAFGLGAVIKGLKLSAIKTYGVLDQLQKYATDAKSNKSREGAMFAFERLFFELGAKFEPYVTKILPLLLSCFGDSAQDVREATHDAARVVMSHLTTYGVKLVMPLVLRALEEKQWRTKLESISLLGAMAYMAPAQLSSSLPLIVPRLLDTKSDPHVQIQTAAKTALKQIGSVIRNPEIARLAPSLLRALMEPDHTQTALEELMRTTFAHSVDPASLALIVPILRSGLKARGASPKMMSAQVVGALCALTDDVDALRPYAQTLLSFLKSIVVDPIPDVRGVAARALGTMVKAMRGTDPEFDTMAQWLSAILKGDNTSVQRSGAAQGLANVLHASGIDSVKELFPDILEELENKTPSVREGYMALLYYLPDVFMQDFNPMVPDVFPVVLTGLADSSAPVRETALKAGQSLVLMFAKTRTELLVPGLEKGIGSDTWSIRESAVQLLGVLLLRLAGVRIANIRLAGGGMTEDDETKEVSWAATREQEKLVEKILGTERRNAIFASIYLMRADAMPTVRTAAYRVWKSVVQNTARMLQTLLPAMMNIIIMDLAGGAEERVHAASETLADLVAKFGDLILSRIIPILQDKLHSDDAAARQGVCLALGEVMSCAHKSLISAYMTDLITGLREALCDPLRSVRAAAGRAFETLYNNVGKKAIDEIVPALVDRLDNTDQNTASLILEGMREILAHASKDVLPYLIPALSKSPLSVFHARALAGLSDVLGEGFQRYVGKVTNAMVEGMATNDEERNKAMSEAAAALVLSLQLESVQTLLETLVGTLGDTKKPKIKLACLSVINAFCSGTKNNFDTHLPLLLSSVVALFVDADASIQACALTIVESIVRVVTKESLAKHISLVLRTLTEITTDRFGKRKVKEVPALCTAKGLGPILPMFIDALMHGSPEVRETAANGLGELIELTSEKALAPSVIKVTGPLIRIVGDRFPPNVKSAILATLCKLIDKTGKFLKPFLPQLQTTFVKSLHDLAPVVRTRAASGLASLMKESKRVEPLLTELVTSVRAQAVPNIRSSLITALTSVMAVVEVGSKVEKPVFAQVQGMATEMLCNDADAVRRLSAKLLGTLLQYVPAKDVAEIVRKELLADSAEWKEREGRVLALVHTLRVAPALVGATECEAASKVALARLKDDNVSAREAAIQLVGQLMRNSAARGDDAKAVDNALNTLLALAQESKANIQAMRVGALNEIASFAEQQPAAMEKQYLHVLEKLVPWVGDLNLDVKKHIHQTIYFVLQYHVTHDKSQELLEAAVEHLQKADETDLADMLSGLAKKTLSRLEVAALQKREENGDVDDGDDKKAAGGKGAKKKRAAAADDSDAGSGDDKDGDGDDDDGDDDAKDVKGGDSAGDDDEDDASDGGAAPAAAGAGAGRGEKSSAGKPAAKQHAASDEDDDDDGGDDLGIIDDD